jgi:hypothetical protein
VLSIPILSRSYDLQQSSNQVPNQGIKEQSVVGRWLSLLLQQMLPRAHRAFSFARTDDDCCVQQSILVYLPRKIQHPIKIQNPTIEMGFSLEQILATKKISLHTTFNIDAGNNKEL